MPFGGKIEAPGLLHDSIQQGIPEDYCETTNQANVTSQFPTALEVWDQGV